MSASARPERMLMGPGPSNPYPEAMAAMGRPLLGHLDPEFLEILDDVCAQLRRVFRTGNALTLPVSGTGSAGMEAAFANLVGPGDHVVVAVNGLFGQRMVEVADRCGATVHPVEHEWGAPVDADRVLAAHPAPKVIAVVHAETSTGVRSDVAALGEGKGDALLLVDCVTSLGGIEVDVDGWGIDVAYAGTQKCLGVPPGLAPLTVGDRARERFVDRSQSWYLDLRLIGAYTGPATGRRTYHHTAPVAMVQALHGGLGALLAEGLPAAWARHEACGAQLHAGLRELGLELFAPEGHRLPQLTTVRVPAGVDDVAVRTALLDHWGIEIGGGVGAYAGVLWRIGCMGHTARPENVERLLDVLGGLVAERS